MTNKNSKKMENKSLPPGYTQDRYKDGVCPEMSYDDVMAEIEFEKEDRLRENAEQRDVDHAGKHRWLLWLVIFSAVFVFGYYVLDSKGVAIFEKAEQIVEFAISTERNHDYSKKPLELPYKKKEQVFASENKYQPNEGYINTTSTKAGARRYSLSEKAGFNITPIDIGNIEHPHLIELQNTFGEGFYVKHLISAPSKKDYRLSKMKKTNEAKDWQQRTYYQNFDYEQYKHVKNGKWKIIIVTEMGVLTSAAYPYAHEAAQKRYGTLAENMWEIKNYMADHEINSELMMLRLDHFNNTLNQRPFFGKAGFGSSCLKVFDKKGNEITKTWKRPEFRDARDQYKTCYDRLLYAGHMGGGGLNSYPFVKKWFNKLAQDNITGGDSRKLPATIIVAPDNQAHVIGFGEYFSVPAVIHSFKWLEAEYRQKTNIVYQPTYHDNFNSIFTHDQSRVVHGNFYQDMKHLDDRNMLAYRIQRQDFEQAQDIKIVKAAYDNLGKAIFAIRAAFLPSSWGKLFNDE